MANLLRGLHGEPYLVTDLWTAHYNTSMWLPKWRKIKKNTKNFFLDSERKQKKMEKKKKKKSWLLLLSSEARGREEHPGSFTAFYV